MKLLTFNKNDLNSTTRLFDELLKLPEFNQLSKMDDLVICNLDSESLHSIYNDASFYDSHFGIYKFKVFVVHELDKGSIPFLKCADLLVFLTKNQQRKFNALVKMNIPSVCIPYPISTMDVAEKSNNIAFLADFLPEHMNDYIQFVKSWGKKSQKSSFKIYDTGENKITSLKNTSIELLPENLTAIFVVNPMYISEYNAFKLEFDVHASNAFESINIIESDSYDKIHLDDALKKCAYSYIFNKELSQNKFNNLIRTADDRLIYTKFKDNFLLTKSISHKCKTIIADGISTQEKNKRPTESEFIDILSSHISKYKNTRKRIITKLIDELPIDHINDLNIVLETYGAKNSDYFFVVNFRNQADKIIRCLESINEIAKPSSTIIITDDNSTDDSRNLVKQYLVKQYIMGNKSPTQFIFISNDDRKYASRNLFNAISNFVTRPDSIIIEIDGDDYLNINQPIMTLLDAEYKKGILTTHGQLMAHPVDFGGMEKYNNIFDTKNQWNQNKCASWLPLRTYKATLFNRVDLLYFIDMENGGWLKSAHDASIHSRMIELANGKVSLITEPLYMYDCSGYNHDAIAEEWSPLPSYRKLYHVITY